MGFTTALYVMSPPRANSLLLYLPITLLTANKHVLLSLELLSSSFEFQIGSDRSNWVIFNDDGRITSYDGMGSVRYLHVLPSWPQASHSGVMAKLAHMRKELNGQFASSHKQP